MKPFIWSLRLNAAFNLLRFSIAMAPKDSKLYRALTRWLPEYLESEMKPKTP